MKKNFTFEIGFWKACAVSNCYSMTHIRPVFEGCSLSCLTGLENLKCHEAGVFKLLLPEMATRRQHWVTSLCAQGAPGPP